MLTGLRRSKKQTEDPNNWRTYENYAGRGIKVCKRWQNSYPNSLHDMGRKPSPGHSLDRKNVNKGYCKSNCRWADSTVQNNNRRMPRRIETFSAAEISREIERRKRNRLERLSRD